MGWKAGSSEAGKKTTFSSQCVVFLTNSNRFYILSFFKACAKAKGTSAIARLSHHKQQGINMNEHRIRLGILTLILYLTSVMASGNIYAQTLDEVLDVRAETTQNGRRSQVTIDGLSEQTRSLLDDYKQVMKIVDGLIVYNQQQERLVNSQNQELRELDESIDNVTVIERQMGPLIERMIMNLEKFIELDIPFLMDERTERIDFLKDMFDRADVSVAEKFSQVLQSYQVENTYGSSLDVYTETIELDGVERQVEMLKWGRVALVFQTLDGEVTGVWDNINKQWQILDDDFRLGVRNGFRIAKRTQTADFVHLPIPAPGQED